MIGRRPHADPRLEEIKGAVEVFDTGLDEVTRARIESKLLVELERLDVADQARPPRWRRPLLGATVAAGIALLGVATWPDRAVEDASPAERRVIVPGMIAGFEPEGRIADAMFGAGVDTVEVPAGGIVRAELGDRARIAVIGPARLEVATWSATRTVLELDGGVVVADVKPDPSRVFSVSTRAGMVDVLGTRFAVDARVSGALRVAVARGEVEVKSEHLRLRSGESWPARDDVLDRALAELDAIPESDALDTGVLHVTSDVERVQVALQNGRVLGPAPLRVKLIAGAAQLAITREGEPARSIEARVQKDNVAALHVAWPKAAAAGAAEAPTPEGGAPGLARISRVLRSAPGSAEGRTDETAGAADSKLAETMLGDSKLAGHAPRDDAEALYLRAELAMQAHDDAAAIADLETLVRLHAGSALADTALLELARIRSTGGDNTRARQDLETLLARKPDAALAETAHHSLCKLQVEAERTEEALACLASFERTYPSSAHRQAVLRALAGLSERAHGCRAALDWIAKLAASYPHDPLARELEARRRQCRE